MHKYAPDAVAIETLFMTRNQKTAMKVAEARGVAILAAAEAGIPLFEYSPQAVKIAVTRLGQRGQKKRHQDGRSHTETLCNRNASTTNMTRVALGLAHQGAARIRKLSTAI